MRRIVLIVLGCLAGLIAAEVGYRGWLASRGRSFSHAELVSRHRDQLESMVLPLNGTNPPETDPLPGSVPHPFFGWQATEDIANWHKQTAYFKHGASQETFDIVCVGGAIARQLTENNGRLLRQALVNSGLHGDTKLKVLYLGHPAYKQPQQVNAVTYALSQGWRPDLVVNVDGHNELVLANENHAIGAHPLMPSAAHWKHLDLSEGSTGEANDHLLDAYEQLRWVRRELERLESSWLARSALVSGMASGSLELASERFEASVAAFEALANPERPLGVFGPESTLGFRQRMTLIADQWASSSRMLHAACRAHGVDYLHVLGPSALENMPRVPTEDPATATGGDAAKPSKPSTRATSAGYPMMRERVVELLAAGVDALDASELTTARASNELFADSESLTNGGVRRLSALIAERYMEDRP